MSRKGKIFIVLSLVLLASDLGLVAINYRSAQQTLMASVRDRGAALRESFTVALYTTELKLVEIATFVSQTAAVQEGLREGHTALAAGDSATAERWRRSLLEVVGPHYTQLRFRYMLRQFAFYLPPDDTAFLHVDVPYVFGNRARQPDSLVAMAAANGQPRSGFDVDELSVGLRAAVPIQDTRPGHGEQLGVIEVGSALDTMLIPICPNSQCGTAVLLSEPAVRGAMAAPAVDRTFTADRRVPGFFVEATSNPALTRALMAPAAAPSLGVDGVNLLQLAGRWNVVATFPLVDHLGKDVPARPPLGVVATWEDMDDAVGAFQRSQLISVAYGVVAFLLAEILVWRLLTAVIARLEREIDRRTVEVRQLLDKVSQLAQRDPLTNLFNRRAFSERLREEMARCLRSGKRFSLVMIDLDRFKQVNDSFGHPVGDEILCRFADLLDQSARTEDMAGRFGGEEFCLLLPDTPADQAMVLVERLRRRFADVSVHAADGRVCQTTFSAGVAEWAEDLDEQTLYRLADEALYQAKAGGRDRAVKAPSPVAGQVRQDSVAFSKA